MAYIYGLNGPRCPLSLEKPLDLITHSLNQSITHTTVLSANMPFHSTTIFTLAHLLPLSLAHLPQQKHKFELAIFYNKSIADAHPSFLLEEAILLITRVNLTDITNALSPLV